MIYDAFLFLNELDLLELRLHTLAAHVDRFVLVESNQTFSTLSDKGEFVFEKNAGRFERFRDKIIYVKLDNEFMTGEGLGWTTRLWHFVTRFNMADHNETLHRNAIVRGLEGAAPDDVVIISDVDEIVDPACLGRALELLAGGAPAVGLEQAMYRWLYNNRELDFAWTAPRVTTCGFAREKMPHRIRWMKVPVVKGGGWHFSSVGSRESLRYKIQSFLHHDLCYRGPYREAANLQRLLEEKVIGQGRDIFHFSKSRYRLEEIDERFPPYLRENLASFGELVRAPGGVGEGAG